MDVEEMLFGWTAGERIETMPLIDALYYIKTGRHMPELVRDYPDELASPRLIKEVREKIRETQGELLGKHPSGYIRMYRGGGEGSSWTTSQEQAEFFAGLERGKGRLRERDVPIGEVAFYLEPYTREPGEEEYILL